jgi:hypothetical protein
MLHAQTPSVQAGAISKASRMIYPTTSGLKLVEATETFTDVMQKTFENQLKFDSSNMVTPGLPTDWLGTKITIPSGVPITLNVHIGLVAEVSATRDNQFTASVGAFAKAESSVGLFIFSKLAQPCTGKAYGAIANLPTAKYESICLDVLKDASVTEAQINACTVPTAGGVSGSCSSDSKWLVLQKRTGPTVETGFSAPTLTATNSAKVEFGVGFYPMYVVFVFVTSHSQQSLRVRLSVYGFFKIYLAPHMQATITANPVSTSCSGGISIEGEFASVASTPFDFLSF